jgi:hypothetical protein
MNDTEKLKQAIDSIEGEFELIREIGRGATAVVYLLRDRALERDVALKVIRTGFGGDEEALARLQREARLVAQLTHPNIVKLYGTHRLPDGSFALLMEHVPGRNLKEVLREEGAFTAQQTVEVLKDVASALAYAHRRRIVHRDVKPENIYIDEEVGAARLADFGVARPWDQDARLTLPGASLGTPAYMSPEQIDGLEVDGRSDVYSLGLVGYEMLLGQHPWEGENVFTIIYRQKNEELPLEALRLDDHPVLASILGKALEKDPDARWESAVAFLEQLARAEEEGEAGETGASGPGFRTGLGSATSARGRPGGRPAAGAATGAAARTAGPRRRPDERHDEDLTPVDWTTVEHDARGVGVLPGEPLEDDEAGAAAAAGGRLGLRRKHRWGRIVGALAVVLVAASLGVYRWTFAGERTGGADSLGPTPTATERPGEPAPGQAPGPVRGPANLALLAEGPGSEAPVDALLPLVLHVTGGGGHPLADTLARFEMLEGDGLLDPMEARTDSAGRAEVSLHLPTYPGNVVVLASLAGSPGTEARLELTAVPGPPRQVTVIVGDQQSAVPGGTLPESLGIRVRDAFSNPLRDAEVRFQVLQGGGQVAPSVTRTDDQGRAFARWTLGPAVGTQMVAAVVPGAEDRLLTFQATARAAAPATPPPAQAADSTPGRTPERGAQPGALPSGPVTVVSRTYALGGSHACHLVGGSARCRGANDRGQGGDGTLTGLVALAAGVSHGCGLDVTGGAWCWGANEAGQLGDGTTRDRRPAGAVGTDARFSALAAGLSHTCGLGSGGQVACWGRNANGQLGDGTRQDHFQPAPVTGGQSFRELAAGWNHTCGIASGGQAFCWGSNAKGQIGDGTRVDRVAPTRVQGTFQALAAGASHSCGISGDAVLCWGDNSFGQLGDGTTEDRTSPVRVADLPGAPIALATGAVHSCVVLTDRTAWCWGQNLHGQLGDGTTASRSFPAPVTGELGFLAIFAGGGVTCGFTRDGAEYCWGLNQSGQLGDGTRTSRSVPTRTVQ